MTKYKLISILLAFLFCLPAMGRAQTCALGEKLAGRFLIQVEAKGECYYVDPATKRLVYLGRPADAFALMRQYSLGISEKDFERFSRLVPERLNGRMLLRAQDKGQVYYASPRENKLVFLGRPADAFRIMKDYGLGIKDRDLALIPRSPESLRPPVEQVADQAAAPDISIKTGAVERAESEYKITPPPLPSTPLSRIADDLTEDASKTADDTIGSLAALEKSVFALINEYRDSKGLSALKMSGQASEAARKHSLDMAAGRVPFGHDGFDGRFQTLRADIAISAMAENVAYNYGSSDPAGKAVQGWLKSSGHLKNLSGAYNATGVGAAISPDGSYYFTQIFFR